MILNADARLIPLADESVQCVVTSPPYFGLRNYGLEDRGIGLEESLDAWIANICTVFDELWRVLRDDGTVWLNLGDGYCWSGGHRWGNGQSTLRGGRLYPSDVARNDIQPTHPRRAAGLKPKDLMGQAWRVAFALQERGWYLRSDIVWCLSGGTKLYARTQKGEGPSSLKDLARLDPTTVQLWNGTRWTQVVNWWPTEERDGALEVVLRSGERIGCTPGHLWPTQRGNVRTDELIPGRDVIQSTWLPQPARPDAPAWLPDADVGYLCGLYLAEGSMSGDTVQIAGAGFEVQHRLVRLRPVVQALHGSLHWHVDGDKATINLEGPMIAPLIRSYIGGRNAKTKRIKARAWQRTNGFLVEMLRGYLHGDAHYDAKNDRYRLGFTRNDRLASDLRTIAARIGCSLRLAPTFSQAFGRRWPAYRGTLRWTPSSHVNAAQDGEVVAVRPGKGRKFWDVEVADDPHLFALASGVLTHNSKPNPMPESVTDRPTRAHEYVFLLSKSARYFYDADAVRVADVGADHRRLTSLDPPEPSGGVLKPHVGLRIPDGRNGSGANLRDVWTIATRPYHGAHFATFPSSLVEPCIRAGTSESGCCPECGAPWVRQTTRNYDAQGRTTNGPRSVDRRGVESAGHEVRMVATITTGWAPSCDHTHDPLPCVVLDPFAGSGTTGVVARKLGRRFVGLDLNPDYCRMAVDRIEREGRPDESSPLKLPDGMRQETLL